MMAEKTSVRCDVWVGKKESRAGIRTIVFLPGEIAQWG